MRVNEIKPVSHNNTGEVCFNCSTANLLLILKITDRMVRLQKRFNLAPDHERLDWHMDLIAVNCNDCLLNFESLLSYADNDFVHDMVGIYANLDRTTGRLAHCFYPRCAVMDREVR